jgi:hypothetical protein
MQGGHRRRRPGRPDQAPGKSFSIGLTRSVAGPCYDSARSGRPGLVHRVCHRVPVAAASPAASDRVRRGLVIAVTGADRVGTWSGEGRANAG